MYRQQYHFYPTKRRSSTPDITLPAIHTKEKEWSDIRTILCVDQSLNDSGAALFVDGQYVPEISADGRNLGLALTCSPNWTQQRRCLLYGQWISSLLETYAVDLVVGESHPFARGKQNASIATIEAIAGIRWITMFICGQRDVLYTEFSTNHVKLIMCGSSTASKEAVQMILKASEIELPVYRSKPDIINGNVCDAIAIGEVVSRMQRIEILRKKYAPEVGGGRSQTKNRTSSK
jgi:Holliday junction resolvasome RuvABC endonuclease subunit